MLIGFGWMWRPLAFCADAHCFAICGTWFSELLSMMGHSCHVSLSALPKIFSDSGMVCVANIAVELMKMRCSVSLADKVTRSKLWYDLLEGRTLS